MEISVIIPTKDLPADVDLALDGLSKQRRLPSEVIIIDSSRNDDVEKLLSAYNAKLNFQYHKCDSVLLPGEARNKGLELCKSPVVAFLDSKTIPEIDWLENSASMLESDDYNVIFGSTIYKAKTRWQKIFQASIYGKKPVETLPGSLLTLETAKKIGKFTEEVRAGEDQHWRSRIRRSSLRYHNPIKPNLSYYSISTSLGSELRRHFIYQQRAAKTDAQLYSKIFLLGISVTLLTLLAPNWNLLIGYKISLLYIPNVTKIYLFFMTSIYGLIFLFYQKRLAPNLPKFLIASIVIAGFYIAVRWNAAITSSMDSILYFPHITKIYLLSLLGADFFYRGLISPLRKGSQLIDIMPFNWIIMGLACCAVDIAKTLGYFIGAGISLQRTVLAKIAKIFKS